MQAWKSDIAQKRVPARILKLERAESEAAWKSVLAKFEDMVEGDSDQDRARLIQHHMKRLMAATAKRAGADTDELQTAVLYIM